MCREKTDFETAEENRFICDVWDDAGSVNVIEIVIVGVVSKYTRSFWINWLCCSICQVKAKCPACFWDVPSPGKLYQEEQPLVLRIVLLPDANVELFFYALDVVAGLIWAVGIKMLQDRGGNYSANIFVRISCRIISFLAFWCSTNQQWNLECGSCLHFSGQSAALFDRQADG